MVSHGHNWMVIDTAAAFTCEDIFDGYLSESVLWFDVYLGVQAA